MSKAREIVKVIWKHGRKYLVKVLIVFCVVTLKWVIFSHIDIAEASAPWTITTHFGDIDSVHSTPHKGIDFALPQGTPVKSVTDGTVEVIRNEGNISFGKSVRIRTSDGRLCIYGHLRDWTVQQGTKVHFGDVIGHSGTTGHSTGPHLHFQVNLNGKPINPEPTIMEGVMRKAGDKVVYKP